MGGGGGIIGVEVPVVVEHGSEEGIPAGVGQCGGGGFKDFASNIESHPVVLNSH